MGKDAPDYPDPPDPRVVAQAQSQYNREAAIAQANMNRIDQYAPGGSSTFTRTGTNEDGTPQYRQDTVLSPEQQALYNQQNQVAQALGGLSVSNIDRVAGAQSTPFNYDGMTPLTASVGGNQAQQATGGQPGVQRSVDAGQIATSYDSGGPIQRSVGPDDFSADARRVADSVYSQATSRLDPAFQQRESDTTARLANQGIAAGSEAYEREMGNLGRDRTDAYNDANFRATQAGGAEQSRLFGLDMSQGQFANQSQAQQYAQNQSQATFGNQAQEQDYQQQLGGADLYNNSGQMDLSQMLARLGFNNQASSQNFNQDMAGANFGNNVRQQEIGEATYLRNLPLNDIAALLGTGGGVQGPQFNPFAQVGVAAPDYQGAEYATFNARNGQAQAQQQAQSQMMGQIFGLIGSVGGAAAMSDARIKDRIVHIGTLANGIKTYAFNYIGECIRQFGVMAQEVLEVVPDAVGVADNGYMYVDYGKVW